MDQKTKASNKMAAQIIFFVAAGIILLIAHSFIQVNFGDDVMNASILENRTLMDYLKWCYEYWTSRVLIFAVVVPLAAVNPWVWKVLDVLVILFLVWATGDLFAIRKEDSLKAQILFFLIMWTVPMIMFSSAGWESTTINYLWPIPFALVAMRPLKHWYLDEKCPVWEYILCPVFLIFAANMELVAAIMIGIYLVYGIYFLAMKKKLSPFYFIQVALLVASIVFIVMTPGNANRNVQEMKNHLPEFGDMGIGDKILAGYLNTTYYYMSAADINKNQVFFLFSLVLFVCCAVAMRKKKAGKGRAVLADLVALCPFLAHLPFFLFCFIMLYRIQFPRFRNFFGVFISNYRIPGQSDFSAAMVYLQVAVYTLVLVFEILTIYFIHGKSRETLYEYLILGAGFMSKWVMGFTSTVYISGERTASFCTMAILIVTLRNLQFLLLGENGLEGKIRKKKGKES